MSISTLYLSSFRNHKNKEFDFCKGVTVFWGDNGSGKTSVLEAIHTLSIGKSFRTHRQKTLIRSGDKRFVLKGTFSSRGRSDTVAAQYDLVSGQKIKLNGKLISNRKELIGKNSVVVLSPEEQNITKDGPENRRQFFDKVFCVTDTAYLDTLQKYGRVIKQRNVTIQGINEGKTNLREIESWNEQLSQVGALLWKKRAEFMRNFNSSLQWLLKKNKEPLEIDVLYTEKELDPSGYNQELKKTQKKDIRFGRTTFGPHRDDMVIHWQGKNLRNHGSQGEHKLCLVFLKLAEAVYIKEKTGSRPILLLDDLFAKLDLERNRGLVTLFHTMDREWEDTTQTVITTTDMIDLENSGMLLGHKEVKTHHLERKCST